MTLAQDYRRALEGYRAAKVQFVLTELDLALTFWEMSRNARKPEVAERSAANARRAYATAQHFLNEPDFPRRHRRQMFRRIAKLEPLLNPRGGRQPEDQSIGNSSLP